jgi:glycosyltransferase involved in cell wall biosynthesis
LKNDVLIFNSPPNEVFLPLLLLRQFLHKKNIFVAHGGFFLEQTGFSVNIRKILIKNVLERICNVVSPSHFLHDILLKFFGIESIVIHNGVDLRYIEDVHSQDYQSENNLIFVGLLSKIKGVNILIKAVEKVLDHSSLSCNLYIIGGGELEEHLKNYVSAREINKFITFLGPMDNRQTLSFIKGADVLVLPSYLENCPIVILEAMACGTPVIATNTGGIPEIIENGYNGILVPKHDIDALAEAISFVIQNHTLAKELSKAAKRTVKEKFTLEIMMEKYTKILEDNTI